MDRAGRRPRSGSRLLAPVRAGSGRRCRATASRSNMTARRSSAGRCRAGRVGAGPAERGDRQVLRRDGGRCAAPGGRMPACMRWARWRISTSLASGPSTPCARGGELPPQAGPDRHPRLRRRRRRFRRAVQRDGPPLPLSHPGAAGAAGARSRPAGRVPQPTDPADAEAAAALAAGTISRLSAPPAARPNRLSRRSTAWKLGPAARRSTSPPRRARSCTIRCARWWAR